MFREWMKRLVGPAVEQLVIDGTSFELTNTRDDIDSARVFARARAIMERIRTYQPARYAHLKRDVARIVVQRYPCRGAYFGGTCTVMLELTFMANESFSDSQVAACLVHEAMHARLDHLVTRFGIRSFDEDRARHERICRRAELHFGQAVPDGGPVIERATESIELADDQVAPRIDWEEAARRVAMVDRSVKRG